MNKYQYNALCDVCGFKMKASMLRKRWDGFMVCDKDWEPRNILDFYRTRNDAHLLPFTRPDDAGEHSYTPLVAPALTGTYTIEAMYITDMNNLYTTRIRIVPTTTIVFTSGDTLIENTGYTVGSVTGKGGLLRGASGRIYATVVVQGTTFPFIKVNFPSGITISEPITITGQATIT